MLGKLFSLKNALLARGFRFAESSLGVHVTPVHFYSPIPDASTLDPAIYARVGECEGVDFQSETQLRALRELFPQYLQEYAPPSNSGLARVDAFVLYALIRSRRPNLMIEIGAGESTKVSLAALAQNRVEGHASHFLAIEPYPRPFVRELAGEGFELLERKVQEVSLTQFADADLVFIDSSHVAKIGSDVNYEMLEIVPHLKVGAAVHWHDIMIPADYPKSWIESGRMFWNESYMVHSFMLFNKSFRILWASRYMQIKHPRPLSQCFPYFEPSNPEEQLSSFWVERIA